MPVYERGAHTVEEGYALFYDIVANEDGDDDGRPDPGSFGLTPNESRQKIRARQKDLGSFEDLIRELGNKMSVGGDYLRLDPETSCAIRRTVLLLPWRTRAVTYISPWS